MPTTPRGAGRPPKDAPVLVRDDLLAAAARSFARGYASTSVRRLAAELGVSQAAVQHHARTKEDLFRAVIDEVLLPQLALATATARSLRGAAVREARAAARSSPAGHGRDDDARRLHGLVHGRMKALSEHGGLVLATLEDTSPGAAGRRAFLLDRLRPARVQGLAALKSLSANGICRPISPQLWTAMILLCVPALARGWDALAGLDADGREAGSAANDGPDLAAVLDEFAAVLVTGLVLPAP